MPIPDNYTDREFKAFIENPLDQGTDKRVNDSVTHDKLDSIIDALGGSTSTVPTIINKAVPLANTEVSQALPANTRSFTLRSRLKGTLKLAFTLGGTSTTWKTIWPGDEYRNEEFYTGQTIYVQSNKAGDVLEIEANV